MSALLSRLLKVLATSSSSSSSSRAVKRVVETFNSLSVEKKKVIFQISLSDFSCSSLRRLDAVGKPFGSPRSERETNSSKEKEEKEKVLDSHPPQHMHLDAFHPLQIAGHLRFCRVGEERDRGRVREDREREREGGRGRERERGREGGRQRQRD
jgi:hypothetical protein